MGEKNLTNIKPVNEVNGAANPNIDAVVAENQALKDKMNQMLSEFDKYKNSSSSNIPSTLINQINSLKEQTEKNTELLSKLLKNDSYAPVQNKSNVESGTNTDSTILSKSVADNKMKKATKAKAVKDGEFGANITDTQN